MPYVERAEALEKLETLKSHFLLERQRKAAEGVQGCINTLEKLTPHEVDYAPKTAKITEAVEPWYPGALTGRAVTRCGYCQTQVDRKDKFCRFCGRKLAV